MMGGAHTPRGSRWIRRGWRVGRVLLTAGVVTLWLASEASAQELEPALSDGGTMQWILLEMRPDSESGAQVDWPAGVAHPGIHASWREQLLGWYQDQSFFSARIDSVDSTSFVVEVSTGPGMLLSQVFLTPSPDVAVTSGTDADTISKLSALAAPWEGLPASRANVESMIASLLDEMSDQGYLGARVELADLAVSNDGLVATLVLDRGSKPRLAEVVLEGDSRTQSHVIFPALGLRRGQTLEGVDLELVRSDFVALGLHDAVATPRFELASDSTAILVIPSTPLSPGQFDFVVGALPASGDAGASVIGSGHLVLTNAFGRGRLLEARINRLPGQASSAQLSIETPAPRGWPLVIHAGLEGHQQDSTWNQTTWNGKVLFRLDRGTWIGATYSGERTRTGFSGNTFVSGSQLVPRASTQLGGLSVRVSRLDHPRFPQRGFAVESVLERGMRSSRTREISGLDTLSVLRSERRERLTTDLDMYAMSGSRLGWAAGIDVMAIRAGRPDISELLFLGGARSLRGYDENRFQGSAVGRAFVEARWYVDRSSWGFLFFDAGWVAIDADFEDQLPTILEESEGVHPGYGFGFVFSSAVGPISLSYALNPEETFQNGRVHIGLSFGL